MLTVLALSFAAIAAVQTGLINPAYAVSNNVVVNKIVDALRADINSLKNSITAEHTDLANGIMREHKVIFDKCIK